MTNKPVCKLVGVDGNVFNLIAIVSKTLKRAGMEDKAKEMTSKCFKAASYGEALRIIMEYVEVE